MTKERILELLSAEHQCMLRNASGQCDRECGYCDLVQDDKELALMYEEVMAIVRQWKAGEQKVDPWTTRCDDCKHFHDGSVPGFPEGCDLPKPDMCTDFEYFENRRAD